MADQFAPTRLWRAVSPEGEIWCESSNEDEVRKRARPTDTLQQLWEGPAPFEWRTTHDGPRLPTGDTPVSDIHDRPIEQIATEVAEKRYRPSRMHCGTATDREIEAFAAGAAWALVELRKAGLR